MSAPPALSAAELDALVAGRHRDPFAVLGPHTIDGAVAVRAFRPGASSITFVERSGGARHAMRSLHQAGVFELVLPAGSLPDYRLHITEGNGVTHQVDDPYRYGPIFGALDAHLFAEGTHHRAYDALGARLVSRGGTPGVHFAVWAPNAERVSVVGDFNGWEGRTHPMRLIAGAGVWEIFLPGLAAGPRYKFEVRDQRGRIFQKADPFGRWFEAPPDTASIVWQGGYAWQDDAWMAAHATPAAPAPMSVYEVHLGSWRRAEHGGRAMTYREMAETLVPYVRDLGFTHLELMPVMEHPYTGSWGYQVIGFFAPTSRFGTPDDFKFFVDACHRAGLGVLLDWVPGHFPKDAHGLARFDGTALFEHADPRQGEHQDWGTLIFNYGRHEVSAFLVSSALFWLREFHIDGLRVDAVASMLYLDYSRQAGEWVPNQHGGRENLEAVAFLRHLTSVVRAEHPGVALMAEESTSWPGVTRDVHLGGLGFTHKWNMGWMHDMLAYCGQDPIYRKWHHDKITFSLLYAFSEKFLLPFSHDEVVHGKKSLLAKMPGDAWQQHATLRTLFGYMFVHPGRKLLFMGAEIGQWREWNHDWELDWAVLGDARHAGLQRWVRDLNGAYQALTPLWADDDSPAGFAWIDCHDSDNSVISLLRRDPQSGGVIVAVANFTPTPRHGYRIGVPSGGCWRERLNSDATPYGGSGAGNGGAVVAGDQPHHGHPHVLTLVVPPLGFLLLEPDTP
ncbi:MAG: 1,4-alpha-glucan branching protein GlgB [Acidobacteria bacterium]|nr:1,4-alpha-glucan branching protein GlgB [Acidobacteriota bacterium]